MSSWRDFRARLKLTQKIPFRHARDDEPNGALIAFPNSLLSEFDETRRERELSLYKLSSGRGRVFLFFAFFVSIREK